MPYSRRIPEAAWEGQREFVLSKYLGDNLSLKEVRDELYLRRGFDVTLSQLEYRCKAKWNFDKYLNKTSWQRIASLRGRDGVGEREVFVRGIHIPPRKVAKEIKRRGFLHEENVPRTLVTGPATGTGTSTAGLPLEFPGLRSCPDGFDSDLPGLTRGTVGAEEQNHLVAIGSLRPSEKSHLLSKIINKLLDSCVARRSTDGLPLDLINGLNSVISISKVTSKELGALATSSAAFHAAILRIWHTLFQRHIWTPRKDNIMHCIDENQRLQLHQLVKWNLAASANDSILDPSIHDVFDLALKWGYVEVALLLEPWKNFSSSPGQELESKGIRQIVQLGTKSSLLLMRRIILNGFPEWRRFIMGNLVRFSRTEDLQELLTSASAIFEPEKDRNATCFWSPTAIRGILIDCVNSDTEDSATKKLDIFMDGFEKMGLVLNATHVDSDFFIAAAQQGYLRVLANGLAINQDLLTADERGFTALHAAADFGHLETCKWILQRSPGSQKDVDGLLSGLFVALAQGHFEIVQLFDAQLSVINRRQLSAAEWRVLLCSCNKIASKKKKGPIFLHFSFKVGKVNFEFGRSTCVLCGAAAAASIEGLTSQVHFYLAHGATVSLHPALSATIDPDTAAKCRVPRHLTLGSQNHSATPRTIVIGSLSTRMNCVALLIGSGITPTARDKITSLRAGEWEMTKLLDCYGVPIRQNQTRFEAAICGRDHHCITETYRNGNPGYDSGALCAAVAFSGDSRFIRKLALEIIAQRAASDLGSPMESTAIAVAALRDDTELFMRLLSAIPSPHPSCIIPGNIVGGKPDRTETLHFLRYAILRRSFGGVAQIWHDETRDSLLVMVAMCGRPEMLQELLDRGIQRDLKACSMAVKSGCRRSLEVLLRGQPPLRNWARSYGNIDDPLVAATANWGDSHCCFSLVSQILSAGADINSATAGTLLCYAAVSKNIRLFDFFVQNGADVNARSSNSSTLTALYQALTFGRADVVEFLLDHGADVNAPPPENFATCLQLAAHRFDILEMFIDKKVRVDGDHRLDFIIAVSQSPPFIARRLRQYGSWQDEDDDILEIIKSFTFLRKASRLRIREKVGRELAKRQQVKIQEPKTSDAASNMTTTDDPQSLGILSPDHFLSEWQFGQGYLRDTAPSAELHDWSIPYIDMSTPPYSWEGMEICDQHYGPNLMRQRIGYVDVEEEDETVRLD